MNAWRPDVLAHKWTLPDGFEAIVEVLDIEQHRIEIDELNHHRFNFEFYVNKPMKQGLSLAANVIHSIDGYIVRSIQRRCNYDKEFISNKFKEIGRELVERTLDPGRGNDIFEFGFGVRKEITELYKFKDLNVFSTQELQDYYGLLKMMLKYEPFPVVTVHDEFTCHPNNMTYLRWHYKEILADLAESDILSSIFTDIAEVKREYIKEGNISDKIRKANYHIC